MTELTIETDARKGVRVGSTALYSSILVVTIVLNGFAGPGKGPFSTSIGDVSDRFNLCITPAGFTFAIWGVIYFMLLVVAVYGIVLLERKVNFVLSYRNGGAVCVPFLVILCLNLFVNIGWLFAWIGEQLIWAAILLVLMVVSNVAALCFAAYSFMKASTDLYQVSKADFWMSIIVLNGQAIYTTWTLIACFLNLGIAIAYGNMTDEDDIPSDDTANTICVALLAIILVVFIIYFIIEHTFLKIVANPLYFHYIVYLWAMIGSYVENKENSPVIANLLIANIFFAVFFIVLRTVHLVVSNSRNIIYVK